MKWHRIRIPSLLLGILLLALTGCGGADDRWLTMRSVEGDATARLGISFEEWKAITLPDGAQGIMFPTFYQDAMVVLDHNFGEDWRYGGVIGRGIPSDRLIDKLGEPAWRTEDGLTASFCYLLTDEGAFVDRPDRADQAAVLKLLEGETAGILLFDLFTAEREALRLDHPDYGAIHLGLWGEELETLFADEAPQKTTEDFYTVRYDYPAHRLSLLSRGGFITAVDADVSWTPSWDETIFTRLQSEDILYYDAEGGPVEETGEDRLRHFLSAFQPDDSTVYYRVWNF